MEHELFAVQIDHMRYLVDPVTGVGTVISPSGKTLDVFTCDPPANGQPHNIVTIALGIQDAIDKYRAQKGA